MVGAFSRFGTDLACPVATEYAVRVPLLRQALLRPRAFAARHLSGGGERRTAGRAVGHRPARDADRRHRLKLAAQLSLAPWRGAKRWAEKLCGTAALPP